MKRQIEIDEYHQHEEPNYKRRKTESINSWQIPERFKDMPQAIRLEVLAYHKINAECENEQFACPLPSFEAMRFPDCL
jgi:hypothetical protein